MCHPDHSHHAGQRRGDKNPVCPLFHGGTAQVWEGNGAMAVIDRTSQTKRACSAQITIGESSVYTQVREGAG